MEISRRKRFKNRGKAEVSTQKKSHITFDITSLDLFCSYVLTENRLIRKSHLLNLRNLMMILDMDLYKNDQEKMYRITFINRALEARLVANLSNSELIIKYVSGGLVDTDIDLNRLIPLTTNDLEWINDTISSALKNSFVFNYIDELIELLTRIKTTEYRYQTPLIEEFEQLIDQIKADFRSAKVDSLTEMKFTLRPEKFENIMKDVWDQVTSPSRRLYCMMQGFNQMLSGGFESGRVYMLLGMTGVGKSLAMLDLMYQMKRANMHYKCKDPTKTPVIVLLTMENTVVESVTRLFQMATGYDMRNLSVEEAIQRLREDGELYLTDSSPIDLVIKYMPNRSVDTGYLYTLTEELEDEGYEVIALFLDHIKRIRSCFKFTELRIELGEVVNECKVFAQLKDIPVITCSHLNRPAAETIDSANRGNKQDLTRLLGKANVGESFLMLDNLDGAYIVNVEYDVNGLKHLVWSAIKTRERCDRLYIAQPYMENNDIKLAEDYFLAQPLFKESLHVPSDMISNARVAQSAYSNIEDLDSDNIYDAMANMQASFYSISGNINPITPGYIPEAIGAPLSNNVSTLQPGLIFMEEAS